MLSTSSKYLFSFQSYSSFLNMQINPQLVTSYTQPNFDQTCMKKDISVNLYQKCLILCSRILLNVLYNTRFTVLLPWQHTGSQTSPILATCIHTHIHTSFNVVQSLNSPFFPPSIGAEPGRVKRESRITCMRMLRAPPFSPQNRGKTIFGSTFQTSLVA